MVGEETVFRLFVHMLANEESWNEEEAKEDEATIDESLLFDTSLEIHF